MKPLGLYFSLLTLPGFLTKFTVPPPPVSWPLVSLCLNGPGTGYDHCCQNLGCQRIFPDVSISSEVGALRCLLEAEVLQGRKGRARADPRAQRVSGYTCSTRGGVVPML